MVIVLKSVVTLFILIFLGFIIGKKKILSPDIAPQLCDFLIKVALPVTLFYPCRWSMTPRWCGTGL